MLLIDQRWQPSCSVHLCDLELEGLLSSGTPDDIRCIIMADLTSNIWAIKAGELLHATLKVLCYLRDEHGHKMSIQCIDQYLKIESLIALIQRSDLDISVTRHLRNQLSSMTVFDGEDIGEGIISILTYQNFEHLMSYLRPAVASFCRK